MDMCTYRGFCYQEKPGSETPIIVLTELEKNDRRGEKEKPIDGNQMQSNAAAVSGYNLP